MNTLSGLKAGTEHLSPVQYMKARYYLSGITPEQLNREVGYLLSLKSIVVSKEDTSNNLETLRGLNSGGICYGYDYIAKEALPLHLQALFTVWGKYSGDQRYPVKGQVNGYPITPKSAFDSQDHMWDKENPYCQDRIELLEFMIDTLNLVINHKLK